MKFVVQGLKMLFLDVFLPFFYILLVILLMICFSILKSYVSQELEKK